MQIQLARTCRKGWSWQRKDKDDARGALTRGLNSSNTAASRRDVARDRPLQVGRKKTRKAQSRRVRKLGPSVLGVSELADSLTGARGDRSETTARSDKSDQADK